MLHLRERKVQGVCLGKLINIYMEIQQLYTKCLSEAAYFISNNGEAVVIDPLRDVDVYLQMAKVRLLAE